MAQDLAIRQAFGQGPSGDYPAITLQDSLRVLAYWWRQRGKGWHGWHQALDTLAKLGVKPSLASLSKQLTPKQREVVWGAAYEAALFMADAVPTYTPQPFTKKQSEADAREMIGRYFAKNFSAKLPPIKMPKAPDVPGWFPPGTPKFRLSKPLMMLAVLYLLAKAGD